jgi:hypothetical protein
MGDSRYEQLCGSKSCRFASCQDCSKYLGSTDVIDFSSPCAKSMQMSDVFEKPLKSPCKVRYRTLSIA